MQRDSFSRTSRQRGLSLIEFMVGITIGLIVVIAAVASLLIVRGSSRTMNDSAALEQQATLAMLQIGRQLSQAGAYNAFTTGTNPNTPTTITDTIQFDTRPIGVAQNNALGTTFPLSTFSIFGTDGATGTPPTTNTDALYISYAQSNDGSPSTGCAGTDPTIVLPPPATDPSAPYGAAPRTVSVFTVDTGTKSLTCDIGPPAPATPTSFPIAANIIDMRVSYLSIDAFGNVTYYPRAANVNQAATAALGQVPPATNTWLTINGVQVCLELVGDPTQAIAQPLRPDCQGTTRTPNDGRLHRIVRNTFYLRNPL